MVNRFEKADELRPDAIAVALEWRGEDLWCGAKFIGGAVKTAPHCRTATKRAAARACRPKECR
jgi:hypothetical protein